MSSGYETETPWINFVVGFKMPVTLPDCGDASKSFGKSPQFSQGLCPSATVVLSHKSPSSS